jgi:hypothetical protein
MRLPSFLIFSTFLLYSQVTSAQYYFTGQDPASLKWMQIKTDRFTVIYPKNYGSGGITFAKSLDEAYSELVPLYPGIKPKIPVIIHNFSVQSNGYVAWAPRRMELYPTPEQNSIPLSSERQLSIHELAHAFQLQSLNRGFSKVMSMFLGEQFTGIVAFLLPLWFFEGGAVFAESVLTESGRGRSPSFQKQLKALTVESSSFYKYDKSLNNSFRDYVPDHYQSGYQMVAWALSKYDPQIWNKTLKFTAEQPFTINPVNISLSKSAGLTKKKLYEETFDTLKTIWTKEVSGNNTLQYESLNPEKNGKYINYYSPVFAGTDSIVAIKTSLSSSPAFVLINPSTKTERKIHTPGQMYPWLISYAKGKLVWIESQSDPRWENRDYSIIKLMDLKTSKISRLSRKSRYFAASLSPDGRKIAAIENTIDNKNLMVVIDSETGSVLQTVPTPANVFLQHPQWAEGAEKITVIYLTRKGEGIMSFTFSSQEWDTIIDVGKEDLQSSFLRNDSLFFISSLSGTDNIYIRTPDSKITGFTISRYGTMDLCLNGDKVYFSDYSIIGNNICSATLAEGSQCTEINVNSASFLINRFGIEPPPAENKENIIYTPEPYRKWQHLFKFHSWMPFYADIEEIKSDPTAVRPGISIMTQNQLSTLISTIGYEYSEEKNHVLHSRLTWKGWYPVFESQLDYGTDPIIIKANESVGDPSVIQSGMKFLNTISLPLMFSSGKFSQYIRPSLSSEYSNKYIYIPEESSYDYGQTLISGRWYISNYHRTAIRDIYPKWAQTIDLNYSFAPFDKNIYGSAITIKSSFYLPGLFPNNGIKIRIEKENLYPSKYFFSGNKVSHPRGYKDILSKKIDFCSVDYVFPLVYPDFNVLSLVYLKRIRTGLFYDYASGTENYYLNNMNSENDDDYYHNYQEIFRSFGFELLADFHAFRIPFMISGGVQTAWKNISEKPSFSLLLNIDLFGMTIGRKQL